jgi:hypothetical protein
MTITNGGRAAVKVATGIVILASIDRDTFGLHYGKSSDDICI